MSHLGRNALAALSLTNEQRMGILEKDIWIRYRRATEILNGLEGLLQYPPRHRMPNMLIVGETNNGKTAIANQFLAKHPPCYKEDDEADKVPVLLVRAPPVPDERRLNANLLDALRVPHKTNERADRMFSQLMAVMPRLGVRMLMIDDIQDILAGNRQQQRVFLNVIKSMGNELQIPIAALGTSDALQALQTDGQLANRFVPTPIPVWKFDKDYLRLLASFEEILCLRNESKLTEVRLATRILTMSEGFLGEIAKLLEISAKQAIRDGSERISVDLLESVVWISSSERRSKAAQLI
jgi:hypothetical protein